MKRDIPLAYLETKRPPKTDTALASNIIQHWHARHLYGKALCITTSPEHYAKLARKRWLSLMQTLQKERTQTTDADKLLNLTHSITRMQQMIITINSPHEYPAAHLWFITSENLHTTELPRTCRTIYITEHLNHTAQAMLYEILPAHSLVVDYANNTDWQLTPKIALEDKVHHAWQELNTFLEQQNIYISRLLNEQHSIDSIDDALDSLLDRSSSLLRHARQFQEVLHLAQPLSLTYVQKQQYDLANMLARRVALLTPGVMHHSFIQADNDTFSLYDIVSPQKHNRESLAETVARHLAAGRTNLAKALKTAFVNNSLVI
ncbi:MAG TPA: hypothetical protein VFT59_01800 [Candidatus Saccharimonadales bacterium]|nr:hypothetical protein [Candidatus Saccharimonadales bacterium]